MATYELSIIRTPTFVGRVPLELCEKRYSAFYGEEILAPKVYADHDSAKRAKDDFDNSWI